MKRLNINDCIDVARSKNGKCLSKNYKNNKSLLLWECDLGHTWKSSLYSIRTNGTWCPYCAGNAKITISDCHRLASLKNGECLSKECLNSHEKLMWRCINKHEWETSFSSINSGTWCPYCYGNASLSISDITNLAITIGGECLSEKYINSRQKLRWRCYCGYEWNACFDTIKSGHWCPRCAGKARVTIGEAKDIAIRRVGKCLSDDIVYNCDILKWKCEMGHIWRAKFNSIKSCNSWCPYCKNKTQDKLFRIIGEIFDGHCVEQNYRKFDWLTNPETNRNLEVDIWVPHIKLAIEYDGEQHFIPIRFGGITEDEAKINLNKIKERDELKNKLIHKHKSCINWFIRFTYLDEVEKETVVKILKEKKIIVL